MLTCVHPFFTSVSHQKTFVVKAAEADKTIRGVVFQSTLKKCLAFEIQIMFFLLGGGGEVVTVSRLIVSETPII